ncbi:carboxypeptidase-like regulatory domain-containing protein (plasmid) [Hymenobacter sp. NBH84]|uniref:carboxypeptidase-like regulatory domain-containing protein n=1 Tax=Hymenobacter sp. NBH84 TaxID=2596915 RepID=UPI0016237A7F|nr:carboxypeptidase-like regulatory domain-containing protein [Hymenobacter sp. NBH84]QNE41976.1 carboxypeptidase-like regulatory domain-containing protein [Hymenobacter sp. NBH84]
MLVFLLLSLFLLLSPEPAPYRAVVVDATTSQPLPHVAVLDLQTQARLATDGQGHFTLPTSPAHVKVQHLGYASLEATRPAAALGQVDTLRLLPQAVLLPEVSVRPARQVLLSSLGAHAGQRSRYLVAPGIQYGVRFQPPSGSGTAVLDEITLRLAPKTPTEGRVRVRLVAVGAGALPGSHDLIPVAATYTAQELAGFSDGLIHVDLTPYGLVLPAEGFYVLVEGLPTDPRAVHVPPAANDKTPWLIVTALDPADPTSYQRTNMRAFPAFAFTSSVSSTQTVVRTHAQADWRVSARADKPTKSENLDITLHVSAE